MQALRPPAVVRSIAAITLATSSLVLLAGAPAHRSGSAATADIADIADIAAIIPPDRRID